MSYRSVKEILNAVFDSSDDTLKTVFKTEGEVLNMVMDESGDPALKVRVEGFSGGSGENGGGGVTNHGQLSGLSDDDHPQYLNETRGDARYSKTDHEHTEFYEKNIINNKLDAKANSNHSHDERYYIKSSVDTFLASKADAADVSGKADAEHNHDTRYYKKSEVDTKIDLKANAAHDHGIVKDGSGNKFLADDGTYKIVSGGDSGGSGGVSEHGDLSGLSDDDHPQYFNETRGDTRYALKSHNHDDRYYTETEIDTKLSAKADSTALNAKADQTAVDTINTALASKADSNHNHNDRYYTETEIDTKLSAKADSTALNAKADQTAVDTINTALASKAESDHNHDDRYYTETEIDTKLSTKAKKETATDVAISSGALAIDCSSASMFRTNLTSNISSINFSNVPSDEAFALVLAFKADGTGRTINWSSAVKWSGGEAPTLTADNGKTDIFILLTSDGGTTWFGFVGGQNA